MLTNSNARVATLIAAGIVGFGGIAAAGPGGLSQTLEVPPEETVVTTTTTVPEAQEEKDSSETTETTDAPETTDPPETTEAPETSVAATTEVPPEEPEEPIGESTVEVVAAPGDEDLDTNVDETLCLPDNHGRTVRAVASGDEKYAEMFADVELRDAARSACGKKADSEEDEESESEQAASKDANEKDANEKDADEKDDKPEKGEKSGKGNSSEKSNNGRGKGPKGD